MKFSNINLASAVQAAAAPTQSPAPQGPANIPAPAPMLPPEVMAAPAAVSPAPVPAACQPQLVPPYPDVPPFPVPPFAEAGYGQVPPPPAPKMAPAAAPMPQQAPQSAPRAQNAPASNAPAPRQTSPAKKNPLFVSAEEDDSFLPLELRKARRLPAPVNRNKRIGDPGITLSENLFKDVPRTPAPAVPAPVPAAAPQQPASSQMDLEALVKEVKRLSEMVAELFKLFNSGSFASASLSLAGMAEQLQSCFPICKLLADSDFCPQVLKSKGPEGVFLAVKHGERLGFDPFQALQGITVINRKPCLYGDALLALCMPHGDILEEFDEGKQTAVCTCRRPGRSPVIRTFSMQEALDAGLVAFDKNGHALGRSREGWTPTAPWGAYPKRMLQMRARGFALRDAFPDVLKGIISAEEASDYRV